jgi:hypothetical protein
MIRGPKEFSMFRAHVTKVSAVFLLTLTLGAVSTPARAAGFSSEGPSRWEQLAQSFFGWLMKTTACIDPNGGALCNLGAMGGNAASAGIAPAGKTGTSGTVVRPASSGMIDPDGAAALCLDYCGMIDPNGSH